MATAAVMALRPGNIHEWLRHCLLVACLRCAPGYALRHLQLTHGELGLAGEELAARYLARKGWRILGRRLVTPYAEVDLLIADSNTLACVEVKTGRLRATGSRGETPALGGPTVPQDTRWRPGLRCDGRRVARLWRALGWLARRSSWPDELRTRVDLVEVSLPPGGGAARLVHIAGLESGALDRTFRSPS